MAVEANGDPPLFQSLKLDDPIWLAPRPWESIPSESGRPRANTSRPGSSTPRPRLYETSAVSETSLVRLAMNALCGFQSALVSIEKLSAVFCSEPADRTSHQTSSLWTRSLSTHALGKLLKSIGSSGIVVFLIHEFIDYFTNLKLDGNAFGNSQIHSDEDGNHCHSGTGNVEFPRKSLVNQAFGVAVGKVLEGYICALDTLYTSVALRRPSKSTNTSPGVGCLTTVVHSEITLLEVYLHTKELITYIQAIGNICNLHHIAFCFSETSIDDLVGKAKLEFHKFPRGGELLSYLYSQLQVADPPQCAVLKFLFIRSCEPYIGFIRSWIFEAEISDPYKEFIVEDVNSNGNTGVAFDLPMAAVRERHDTPLPCFLEDFLVPLFRAGQQLQVLKKLLDLCSYTAVGYHNCEDILPFWHGFSSSILSFAYPLTFSKGIITDLACARDNLYRMMWQNLENSFAKLQFRYEQVAPLAPGSFFGNKSRTPTIPDLSASSDSWTASLPTDKREAVAVVDMDVEASREIEDMLEPLEAFECSSSVSSEDQIGTEQPTECAGNTVHLEEKYLSALRFSPCIPSGSSLLKHTQSKESHTLGSTPRKIYDARDLGSVCSHFGKKSSSSIFMQGGLGSSNWLTLAGSQYANVQLDACWPLDSVMKYPFHADQGVEDCSKYSLSESVMGVSNGNVGASKGSISVFTKFFDCDKSLEEPILKDESVYETPLSYILHSRMLKFKSNIFSMNPALSKSAVSNLPVKPMVECKASRKVKVSCFDFSCVQNPCELYAETSANNVLLGDELQSSLVTSFPAAETCTANTVHYFGDELQSSLVTSFPAASGIPSPASRQSHHSNVPLSYLMGHSAENVILPSIAEETSRESSLADTCNAVGNSVGDIKESLMAMFEIPIDFVVDKCLRQEILLQYKYVSKLTIRLLEDGFHLQEHLLALRRYHFMEFADWADLFIESLWHHKQHVVQADEKISDIQGLLELSVQRSSCALDHNKDRLYIYNKGHAIMPISMPVIGLHSFDYIGLGYRLNWPINIILTPDALRVYADIFTFLLRVKLAVVSLNDDWRMLKDLTHSICQKGQPNLCSREMRRSRILIRMRHQLNHFVSMLHQYVQSQLSQVSWFKFLYSLKHKVRDMMDLESLHMEYLRDALHICFLSKETQSVARIIKSILQCALDFHSCLGGIWDEDGLNQRESAASFSQIKFSQVLDLRAVFENNIKELYVCYVKSSKHQEFGLSRFWGYLNFNECYSGGNGNDMGVYSFTS